METFQPSQSSTDLPVSTSPEEGGESFEERIGEAMRQDAEAFEGNHEVTQEYFILSHGRISERVKKTALEILMHRQPITPQ